MRKKSSILYLLGVAGVFITLIGISAYYNNRLIEEGRAARNNENILQSIIEKTNNENKVINESLEGKTIVINVWASWCQPCWNEIPELNHLVERYAKDNIVFIALNLLEKEAEEEELDRRKVTFNYELYYDQKELIELLYSFQFNQEKKALPLNIILDKSGKTVFYYTGFYSEKIKTMDQYLKNL